MSHLIIRVVSCRGEQDATEYNTAGRGAICGRKKRPDHSPYCILGTEVDTETPGRQGFCAKISDKAPSERLPRRYAYILRRLTPEVLNSASKPLALHSEESPARKDPKFFLIDAHRDSRHSSE